MRSTIMAKQEDHQPGGADPPAHTDRLRNARAIIEEIDSRVRPLLSDRKVVFADMRQRLAACKHLGIPVDAECEQLANDPGLDDVVGLLVPPPPSFHKEVLRHLRARATEGATAAEVQRM
jgi:hypothetical protein